MVEDQTAKEIGRLQNRVFGTRYPGQQHDRLGVVWRDQSGWLDFDIDL